MADGLVLVPAYNEAERLAGVLKQIRDEAPNFDVLVVDDGSDDDTAAIAKEAGAAVARHPCNLGYGAALQTGYRYALRKGHRVLVQIDGDGQHDPKNIPQLAQPILDDEFDVVMGSRFHPESTYRMQLLRRLGSRWFSMLVRLFTGLRITDPTTGFQALSPKVLELYVSAAFPADYPDADMAVLLYRNSFRIGERPVQMFERPDAVSMHNRLTVLYYVYKLTLTILMNLLRPRIRNE